MPKYSATLFIQGGEGVIYDPLVLSPVIAVTKGQTKKVILPNITMKVCDFSQLWNPYTLIIEFLLSNYKHQRLKFLTHTTQIANL